MQTELKPIEPEPKWEEEPIFDGNNWCGRFRYLRQGYDGGPEVDVDVCVIIPPDKSVVPIEINGKWYWNRRKE